MARKFVHSIVFIACVLDVAPLAQAEEFRSWTTPRGSRSRIKMAAVGVSGSSVRFKRQDDGREFDFPISRLSAEDQEFVRKNFADEIASSPADTPRNQTRRDRNPVNADGDVRWPHPTLTDDNLDEWLTFIQPTKQELTWRNNIRWHTSLAAAAEEARRLKRPILLWTMNGNSCGET